MLIYTNLVIIRIDYLSPSTLQACEKIVSELQENAFSHPLPQASYSPWCHMNILEKMTFMYKYS